MPNNTATSADDSDGVLTIQGVVEGVVPTNHEDQTLAGAASFLPSYRIREFIDFAERFMLEQIVDKDLFARIADLKERKDRRGTTYDEQGGVSETFVNKHDNELPNDPVLQASIEGSREGEDTPHIDRQFQKILTSLREHHTPEEVDAILATVEREKKEVAQLLEKEGGDVDDVIEVVRRKTYEEKDRIMAEIEQEMAGQRSGTAAEGDRKQA